MNAIQKTICAGLVLASMAGGAPLRADGVQQADTVQRESALQINQANELLRGGNVDGAIGAYQKAREVAPESADLSYNMAVAQYRKGDVAAAEPLFRAAATSENDTLAARSRYNLGNCDYAAGLQLAEKDRPAAIEKLESAIANYRSALDVDTNDADARTNIELATRLIDKLREEQKQQEQQQNQQQQQQDQQQSSDDQQQNGQQGQQDKQQQENKDQKQSNQKQDEQQKNDQQQQSQGDKGQEEQSKQEQPSARDEQQQKQDEKSKEEQSKQEKSQSQQQSEQEAGKEDQKQQSQSQPNLQQQKPNQSLQQKEPSSADQSPEKHGKAAPKGELNAAGKEDTKDAKQQEQELAAFDPAKDGEMTKQEAEKMLQAIRDRDMLRRLRREAAERSQYEPVDRDW